MKNVCGYVYMGLYLVDVNLYSRFMDSFVQMMPLFFSVASHMNWLKENHVSDLYKSGFCTVKLHKHLRRQPNIE